MAIRPSSSIQYNSLWQGSRFKGVTFSGSVISQFINDVGYITASLTSSYAVSSSYALTASYALNGGSGGSINTSSLVTTSSFNSFTASYYLDSASFSSSIASLTSTTSSYVLNSQTSSMTVLSASYSDTASYVENAQTASYILQAVSSSFSTTSSYALTASYALNSGGNIDTSSFATTGSNTFNGTQIINGNVTINGTASIDYLNVTYESSSVIYSSGSNQLGDATNDIQLLIGTTIITGSLEVTGSANIPNITGSLLGTSSYADQALSSSYALSASYAISSSHAITSSYALTASYVNTLYQDVIISGSLNVTSSFTASGLRYPSIDDGAFSFIQTDGAGNLSLQYVNTIYETVYNGEATTLTKGTAVYISGSQGANPKVFRADASDSTKMPVSHVVAENIATASTGRGAILGLLTGLNLTGLGEAGTQLWADGNGSLTNVRPTGSTDIVQPVAVVTKAGVGGQINILNPGPVLLNNLPSGSVWVGDSSNYPVAILTSSLNVASASYASTASYVTIAQTASYVLNAISSSYSQTASYIQLAQTASYVLQAISASFASTSSYVLNAVSSSFSTTSSYALTASYVANASSFPFTGSAIITGSLTVTGSSNLPSITGSLEGTASYAITASHALNVTPGTNVTASFSNLSTWTFNHMLNNKMVIIQVYDTNWNQLIPETVNLTNNNTVTISFISNESGYAVASLGGSATAVNSISSSYALTASYALNASSGGVQVNDLFSYQFLLMGA